ncbi:MAG TPA: DUF2298 domain-containing protein [Candidatus Paceibacterota bacterium]|nr:DUF2298 domain-containing protein [Candidatus Paceibacterota bacterium]
MLQQYLLALWFYIVFSLFAALGLAITLRIIKNASIAYAISKIVGLSLFGYAIWFFGSLHVLDYQSIWLITVLFLVTLAIGAWSVRDRLKRLPWQHFLLIEAVSLALYILYVWLRSHNPQAYGTERFMDMMLLQASGKTNFFPPADSWYAGHTLNYYYYGQYLLSLIANLSRIPYALAYNFSLALLFCQSLVLGFAACFVITKSKLFSALSAFLVVCAGTLFYAATDLYSHIAQGTAINYPSSTRLYTPSYIINEIPSYSFTVGDLHAHVIALAFFLASLVLLWAFARAKNPRTFFVPVIALQFTTSALVNATDAITLNLVFGLIILYKLYRSRKSSSSPDSPSPRRLLIFAAATVALEFALYFPFLHSFKNPTLGVGFAPAFAAANNLLKGYQYPTPALALLGMWGAFLLVGIPLLWIGRKKSDHLFPELLTLASVLIIIGVELFFIRDIYSVTNPPFFRANTVFKFGYHAWIMLSIAFCAGLASAYTGLKKIPRIVMLALVVVFVFLGGVYPYEALQQFFFAPPAQAQTLDSSAFLAGQSEGDYDTVQYINKNITDRAVILEAAGDSYSYYARMSVFTGQIAVMGWKSHEWTWRFDGSTIEEQEKTSPSGPFETGWGPISGTSQDVQTIYETPDAALARQLLEKYRVQYVYIGDLERSAYRHLNEQKFYSLGQVVFGSHGSLLFKLF